jgi:heme O synthase-like polyprenyltransferase
VIVAVFQWGWAADLIGLGKAGPIEPWLPMFLFAIVFGLSMDYEVFLLSRIKEEYDRTGDNATAVADGLAATARVITAAAAIMVCVFAAFVLGDDRALKLFACSSCRQRWSFSETATGGFQSGSTAFSRVSTSKDAATRATLFPNTRKHFRSLP